MLASALAQGEGQTVIELAVNRVRDGAQVLQQLGEA